MRQLIKRFEEKKKTFSNATQDVKLSLPAPLDRLNVKGRVNEGELIILQSVTRFRETFTCRILLTLASREMKKLINSCVSNIIKLIGKQIDQISNDKNRRTKVRSVQMLWYYRVADVLERICCRWIWRIALFARRAKDQSRYEEKEDASTGW
jgi:hypothetical protein